MTWFGKNEMLCGDVDIFKYVFFKNKYACIYIFVLKTYIYIVDIHNVFKYVFTKNKYVYIYVLEIYITLWTYTTCLNMCLQK